MGSYPGRTARPLVSECRERHWRPGCIDSESFSEGLCWAPGAGPSLQFKARDARTDGAFPSTIFELPATTMPGSMEPENETVTEGNGVGEVRQDRLWFLEGIDRINRTGLTMSVDGVTRKWLAEI